MTYEHVEKYLREYTLKNPPYDPVGAINLLKSIIGNLKDNFTEEDFNEYRDLLEQNEKEFLKRLI